LAENTQNPGRKWRDLERDGDGDKYFDNYRYTPYTTDLEFFRNPNIYEADEVPRVTQEDAGSPGAGSDPRPRGERPTDVRMKEEIQQLLNGHTQVDASDIQVDVQHGVVTLSGNVVNDREKRIVERIIRNGFGILDVNNHLNINGPEQ
jgi:hypothetical protein